MEKIRFSNKLFNTNVKIVLNDKYITINQYDKIADKDSKVLLSNTEIHKIYEKVKK